MVSIGGTPNVVYASLGNAANVPSNITVRNNLAYAPNATNPRFYTTVAGVGGATNVVVSNNSTDAQVKNGSSAGFTAPPFTVPASMPLTVSPYTVPLLFLDNFMPTAGSYAFNTGTTVPAWSDILRYSRPQSSVPDIGAVERH
ncbi:MAG: hypothetical protein HY846_07140 [Nitrosomonadales bacterium]|nr:hypothetical protein [Nitrosomonadales bacterium]